MEDEGVMPKTWNTHMYSLRVCTW